MSNHAMTMNTLEKPKATKHNMIFEQFLKPRNSRFVRIFSNGLEFLTMQTITATKNKHEYSIFLDR